MALEIERLGFLCDTGSRVRRHVERKMTDLDFDQFLDSINNPDMFVPVGTFPHNCLVARPHPAVTKCFLACYLVVEISEYYTGGADDELSWLVIGCNFVSFWGHKSSFDHGQ